MILTQMELHNYRNIEEMCVSPCNGINLIYGNNGQGKTNLMEAIWLFTGNSSFRGAKTGELIRFGQKETALSLTFSDRQREQKTKIFLGEKKKILLNGVEQKTMEELNGSFYAVVFSPSHLSFIQNGPNVRRQFLDIAISEIRPQYEKYLQTYKKLIEQRNALLQNADRYPNLREDIDVWDIQLARVGTILSLYRNDYIKKLQKIAKQDYAGLSSQKENLSIRYESTVFPDIEELSVYEETETEQYYQKLKDSFLEDNKMGWTSVGIHRDDLNIQIDEKSARKFGSQGQQRSSMIAIKLAEAELLKKVTGESPVMLLDDVMSELDSSRQNYILNHLKNRQVFITCCEEQNITGLKSGKAMKIQAGTLMSEETIG